MRMTCDIRNIDEEMLDDTIIESSGDSVRSNLYPSYSSTSRIVTSASSSLRNILRVCSHCGTSKTPLWRSGPRGPKSLCNACGIRLKKAGRHSKADLRTASVPSPGKSPKASTRHVTLRHMRHISKKSKFCIDNDAEESSEMENVSYSTMPHTVIPHYASRHHAEHSDVTHLNSLLAKFHKKKNLARGIRLCNAVPRDEAEGAISLMALSSGC